MSPTTSIPVFRISLSIEVTSTSSTLNRCWISLGSCHTLRSASRLQFQVSKHVPKVRIRRFVRETADGMLEAFWITVSKLEGKAIIHVGTQQDLFFGLLGPRS